MYICSICSDNYLKLLMNNNLKFIDNYSWLLNSFVLDFFCNSHWRSLPLKWREQLNQLEPQELGTWISTKIPHNYKTVWPLSLLAFRSTVQSLSISRTEEHEDDDGAHCQHCRFINFKTQENSKLFSKHIKPKKFHEINKMAQVTSNCAIKQDCHYIVDVGSGLGHLGRILALRHGLNVCCLELQSDLTLKARKLDEELKNVLIKTKRWNDNLKLPIHINLSVTSNLNSIEFMTKIQEAFNLDKNENIKIGIVGLHPCGDLGPTLLRLFTTCSQVCFINLVGCCYMKLTIDSSSNVNGYPMSIYTKNIDKHDLSYESREVACHAIENYSQRLIDGCADELKVHCYRATLENIIVNLWPELKHSGLKSLKNVQDMEFHKYAKSAVESLGINIPNELLHAEEINDRLNQWFKVVIFYSLRILLAMNVETALLLDRSLYLSEQGISNLLIPAFNPELSPRNHILIALKDLNKNT